ncbi:hypothetical protein H8959_004744 [Pygathrix nigripes]
MGASHHPPGRALAPGLKRAWRSCRQGTGNGEALGVRGRERPFRSPGPLTVWPSNRTAGPLLSPGSGRSASLGPREDPPRLRAAWEPRRPAGLEEEPGTGLLGGKGATGLPGGGGCGRGSATLEEAASTAYSLVPQACRWVGVGAGARPRGDAGGRDSGRRGTDPGPRLQRRQPPHPPAVAPARRASHAWAPRCRLVPHAPAGGITSQSPAARLRAALPPQQTLVPRPAPAAAPGTPGAGPRIGAGGDVKRRHGGGPGAGRGGAAADCGDAAARGAAQSVLGAERRGACWCGGRGSRRAGRGRELGRAGAESGVGPGELGPGEEQPWRRGGSGPEPLRAAWAPSSRAGPERGWRRRQLRPRPPPSQAPRPAPGPRRW